MTRQNGPDSLTGSEFAKIMIGVPWRNRACSLDASDCWGLAVLYYRYVAGVEIHHSRNYESGDDFRTCFSSEVVFWRRIEAPQEGCLFVAYAGRQPAHVGVIVDGRALHSRGSGGSTRSDRLAAVARSFTKLEFFEYAADRDTERSRDAA